MGIQRKRCPRCKKLKTLDKFYKRNGPTAKKEGRVGAPYGYCKPCNNKRMADTPYKFFSQLLSTARLRTRYKKINRGWNEKELVDKNYLVELYKKQKGLCAITGFSMKMERGGKSSDENYKYNISMDRIDNSLGYVVGNIRLVTKQANVMRNRLEDHELIVWASAIVNTLSSDDK